MPAVIAVDGAPTPTGSLLAPGDLIDDRYRIESYLGGGGMASVYRATHVALEQTVAIKVISPQLRGLPGMAERFLREARAATHLKGEHVARVSDVGTMADGAPYMVMEFLDGSDLSAVLEPGDEVPIEDAVDFVLQGCEALAEVHGLGIVHRDLKPANLFLTRGADGLPCVKLIDFGISRTDAPLTGKHRAALTQPDMVMGSPSYMSPEQMESAVTADARSDIYGIGAVLYELLTHEVPHEGDTFLDVYASTTAGPPAAPSSLRGEVPAGLDEVVLRCLCVERADRYADTAELALALAPFGPAGSIPRAEGIVLILEAARARTREGASDHHGSAGVGESRIRRRVSSSAHALRMRRIRFGVFAAAVLAVGALAVGALALYSQGRAIAVESAAVTTAPALAVAQPVASAAVRPELTTESPAVETAAPAKANAESAAVPPRAVVAVVAAPAAVGRRHPATRPSPAATVDERNLFEDRK